jgi:phosphatidylglycerol:prolipoprotein diacylglycerol transferase
MHPILFKIAGITIHTYGVLIALGFVLALYLGKWNAKKLGIDENKFSDMSFNSLLWGMVGARILYVFTRFEYFLDRPIEIFFVWEGGLVFYGGPIAAFAYIYLFCKKNKINFGRMLDVCSVSLTLAHSIGRLGCLSAGCCHGKATQMPWGIKLYSELVEPSLRGIPIHPTQIYESVSLMFLTLFLQYRLNHNKRDGNVFLTYLIIYPIIRSIIEIFRGDSIRGFVIDNILSTSQFISLLVILSASIFLVIRTKNLKK